MPLPWSGDRPPFGFSAEGVAPWLPQPAAWSELTVAAQQADPGSTLSLYRAALHLRRALLHLRTTPLVWRSAPDRVLAFERGPTFHCVVNLSDGAVALDGEVLLASGPCPDGLPPDTAAWLSSPGPA